MEYVKKGRNSLSVTRFGEISLLWPKIKVFGIYLVPIRQNVE